MPKTIIIKTIDKHKCACEGNLYSSKDEAWNAMNKKYVLMNIDFQVIPATKEELKFWSEFIDKNRQKLNPMVLHVKELVATIPQSELDNAIEEIEDILREYSIEEDYEFVFDILEGE